MMNKKKNTKIAVCYYMRQNNYIQNESCIPLQLGYEETKDNLEIQRDDSLENRGNKHWLYSEYSGVYWLWKNVDADYKGMLQHRRFFSLQNVPLSWLVMRRLKNVYDRLESVVRPHPIGWEEQLKVPEKEYQSLVDEFSAHIDKIWNRGYDIIAPKRRHYYILNVKNHFVPVLGVDLMNMIAEVIKEKTPEYDEDYQRTLRATKCFYYANLEVMKSELFNEYCTFLFTVFDGLEVRLPELFVDPVHEKFLYRKFGYLGEILTSTFISKAKREGKKVKECTVVYNTTAKGEENRKK